MVGKSRDQRKPGVVRCRKAEQRALSPGRKRSGLSSGPDAGTELRESVVAALDRLPETPRLVVALRLMQGSAATRSKRSLVAARRKCPDNFTWEWRCCESCWQTGRQLRGDTMNCETATTNSARPQIDESRRHDGYLALQHLEDCQNCQMAMREYDGISRRWIHRRT